MGWEKMFSRVKEDLAEFQDYMGVFSICKDLTLTKPTPPSILAAVKSC